MEIRIESIKVRPRQLKIEEPVEEFPVLRGLVEKGEIAFLGKISAELVATLAGALVEVEGSLACRVVIACSRCLQPVEQQIDLQVALSFSRQVLSPTETDGDVELTADEIGLIPFEGDTIDLRSPLEQELLMGFPLHPLCKTDCAGLCPACGTDLNHKRCDCTPPVFHGGFAALGKFKVAKD
jgi:uncharacterized protein